MGLIWRIIFIPFVLKGFHVLNGNIHLTGILNRTELGIEAMAPHSSTLAWKIPWTEEPGRLQSTGSQRVGHDWATSLSLSCIGEGNGNPLQCSCLENPRDGEAWQAAVYGAAQSRTRLKRLSCSSRDWGVSVSGTYSLPKTLLTILFDMVLAWSSGMNSLFLTVTIPL